MDNRSHACNDAILGEFASAFTALAAHLGITASAEPDEHYGACCQVGCTPGHFLVLVEDLDPSLPGWANRAAGAHLECVLREAIQEAVEKRAA